MSSCSSGCGYGLSSTNTTSAERRKTTAQSMYEQVNSQAASPTNDGSRIDPVLARSWLLVNGAHADRFEPATHSPADIVVLDIEDAVAPKDKIAARRNVVQWLGAG